MEGNSNIEVIDEHTLAVSAGIGPPHRMIIRVFVTYDPGLNKLIVTTRTMIMMLWPAVLVFPYHSAF